jgi:hypothetical protein
MNKYKALKMAFILLVSMYSKSLFAINLAKIDNDSLFSFRFCAAYFASHIDTFNEWQVLWFSEKQKDSIAAALTKFSSLSNEKAIQIEKNNQLLLKIVEAQYQITTLSDSYDHTLKECLTKKSKRYSRKELAAFTRVATTLDQWRLKLLDLQNQASNRTKELYSLEAAKNLAKQALAMESKRANSIAAIDNLVANVFSGQHIHHLNYKLEVVRQRLDPRAPLEKMIRHHVHFKALESINNLSIGLDEISTELASSTRLPNTVVDSMNSRIASLQKIANQKRKNVQKTAWHDKQKKQLSMLAPYLKSDSCPKEAEILEKNLSKSEESFRKNEIKIIGLILRCQI